jgi:hypothetical protein
MLASAADTDEHLVSGSIAIAIEYFGFYSGRLVGTSFVGLAKNAGCVVLVETPTHGQFPIR